jgi:hypothetical protein
MKGNFMAKELKKKNEEPPRAGRDLHGKTWPAEKSLFICLS